MILPINSFTASAVTVTDNTKNNIIELPFPSPTSFGDCSRSLVIYDNSLNRYTMFVLTYVVSNSVDPSSICFEAKLNVSSSDSSVFNKLNFVISAQGNSKSSENITQEFFTFANDFHLYRFNWSNGSSVYTVAERKITWTPSYSGQLVGSISQEGFIEAINSGSSDYTLSSSGYNGVVSYSIPYNGTILTPSAHTNGTVGYSFTSTDSGAILSVVNKMNSTLNSANSKLSSVNNNLNDINNSFDSANNTLNGIDSKLQQSNDNFDMANGTLSGIDSKIDSYGSSITFYLDSILNQLNDNSYSPQETTTNAAISDYNSAEGALMDNNIDTLNALPMPDLNSFNSGSQKNAFAFISNNIEFFSGMNGSGSVAKIASVLLVILGLGLVSFIIGLTNRRKG